MLTQIAPGAALGGAEPVFRTHPHVDKQAWGASQTIALRDASRPFPLNQQVGVLRWRTVTKDETALPLSVSVWTNVTGDGGCEVNVEYELENADLSLTDVTLSIPMPMGVVPHVGEAEQGAHMLEPTSGRLLWQVPAINADAPSGNLEFAVDAGADTADVFFPLTVDFTSSASLTGLEVRDVQGVDMGEPLPFSMEAHLTTDGFLIK